MLSQASPDGGPPTLLELQQVRDLTQIIKVLSDLILFVTESEDNPDPFTREGLPIVTRQKLLGEQGFIELTVELMKVPFGSNGPGIFASAEPDTNEKAKELAQLTSFGRLGMRLVRHILRELPENRKRGLKVVPSLLDLLEHGIGAADVLTEVFTDNDYADRVEDSMIHTFIDLIRTKGRLARYPRLLQAMCECRGKAVRPNQWRIGQFFLDESPELLVKLELNTRLGVLVSGDASYFPHLTDSKIPLTTWLDETETETAEYFASLCSLYASLVRGRNLRTTPTVQKLLPYDVVLQVIQACQEQERHLSVARAFVQIVNDLYVNNDIYDGPGNVVEAHPPMAKVTHVRVWSKVQEVATAGVLCSKVGSQQDWSRFDNLKALVLNYIARTNRQNASEIPKNRMLLALTEVLYALVEMGFCNAVQLSEMAPYLLRILDGREDTIDGSNSSGRFARKATTRCNTVVIMQAKQQVCRILQLICTIRLDLRLSAFLSMYQQAGVEPENLNTYRGHRFEDLFDILDFEAMSRHGGELTRPGEQLLSARQAGSGGVPARSGQDGRNMYMRNKNSNTAIVAVHGRTGGQVVSIAELAGVPAITTLPPLVPVLLDLMYYDHQPLVSAALGKT